MERLPITSSLLRAFFFGGEDGSDPNDSGYTITIRNDLGLINGVPQETNGQPVNRHLRLTQWRH